MSRFWKGFCPSWKNRRQNDHNTKMLGIEQPDLPDTAATSKFCEIPLQDIEFDRNGFSMWCNSSIARIRSHPEETETVCVIKICDNSNSVRDILRELKIMSHIGDHKNIVKLIGACTQGPRKGSIYMALEYCEHGSMQDYIRINKQFLTDEMAPKKLYCTCVYVCNHTNRESPYAKLPCDPDFCTSLLLRWSQEIAAGMSFIGSKNAIHNDLAIRNIVLDQNLTAKITDFAMAQELSEKCGPLSGPNARIPWKSVAPEIHVTGTVSLKSDVWSYGITLWEILSLGAEPYGDQSCSSEFFQQLITNECSLNQPEFASPEMYQIMKDCWSIDPAARPDFENIQDSLQNLT